MILNGTAGNNAAIPSVSSMEALFSFLLTTSCHSISSFSQVDPTVDHFTTPEGIPGKPETNFNNLFFSFLNVLGDDCSAMQGFMRQIKCVLGRSVAAVVLVFVAHEPWGQCCSIVHCKDSCS